MAHHIISQTEDVADSLLRNLRPALRPMAHFCLLSTFVEDGVRMLLQYNNQASYMNRAWNCGYFLAGLFVFLNLTIQLGASACVMLRFQTRKAVLGLIFVVLLQSIAYQALWDIHFFMKNLSVLGGLVLLYAETFESSKNMFAGVPDFAPKDATSSYQLVGRVLIVLMYMSLVRFDTAVRFIADVLGLVLVSMVMIGFKAKLSALLLVAVLLIENMTLNAFWAETSESIRDFRRYDFFQTLSVIGGLLLVVALGPGGLSVDEHKKQW